jgi:hypothetical protein
MLMLKLNYGGLPWSNYAMRHALVVIPILQNSSTILQIAPELALAHCRIGYDFGTVKKGISLSR